MEGLKELILKEEKRLRGIKEIVDSRLVDVPSGTLRVTKSKNCIQYIQCFEDCTEQGYKLSYIKKQDMSIAYRLAQKSYDQKIKRLVDRRIKHLQKLAKIHMVLGAMALPVYHQLVRFPEPPKNL